MNDKRAKDIMTTDVIVANKNDIIANVANLLIKEKIGGLPVVDEENKVVGIISETDIMKKESHVDSPRMLNFIQGIIFLDDMKKFEDEMRAIAAYKVEDFDGIYDAIFQKVKEINKTMPPYKAIRGITLTKESLIKTTTGKIKRN